VVDLVDEKAYLFPDSTSGALEEAPIPEELMDQFRDYRSLMIEKIAETDENLLVKYLEERDITREEVKDALRRATVAYKVVPVLCGSALQNRGIQPLLDAVCSYLPAPLDIPPVNGIDYRTGELAVREPSEESPFAALAFKTVADPFIGRLVYLRVYSGTINTGSMAFNSKNGKRERLGRIVKMHAQHREEVDEVHAGQIVAAVGLKQTSTGDTICDESSPIILETITFPEPVVSVAIEPKSRADQDRLMDALSKLSDEDPTFKIVFDEETGQTIMSGMGELHLEVLADRMKREYGVEGNVGRPRVAYRETISMPAKAEGKFVRQTGGHGQYGHVWLEMEPVKRGSGIEFVNRIRGGAIPNEFISSIEEGVREALNTGPLSGYPMVDVKISLVDGSYHEVDSSKMSFLVAGSMAAKAAIKKAHPLLLEPIMRLEVVTPGDFLGEVLGDLGRRRANIRNIEGQGDIQAVMTQVPLGESFGYANTLRSLTQGRASYSMEFHSYQKVPEAVAAV
jgi:elongation factor G